MVIHLLGKTLPNEYHLQQDKVLMMHTSKIHKTVYLITQSTNTEHLQKVPTSPQMETYGVKHWNIHV